MEDLDKLIEAVEGGDWSGSWRSVIDAGIDAPRFNDAYHGSLDAAKALHDALLPGWIWGRTEGNIFVKDPTIGSRSTKWGGPSENPARAWLLATLKAHRHNLAKGAEQ